jgi:quinol monooxygenase YgiN
MINVIASVRVKAGKVSEFLGMFKTNASRVRKEKGCIEYFPAVDAHADLPGQNLDENVVTIIEKWESLDALRDHLASPGMQDQLKSQKDFIEAINIKVLQEA